MSIGKKQLTIVIAALLMLTTGFSQKSDVGNWFIYFGSHKISDRWNFWSEVQYRNYNFIGDINQLLIRTGIGYNLTENNNNVLVGYGFVRSHPYINNDEKRPFSEHRIYQQFITKQNIGNFFLQHRYRVEERFVPDDFKMRFRYFLGINKPLNKKAMVKNAVYLSAYNEIFLNDKKPVFDRNRLYGGAGICIGNYFKLELGYMAQILDSDTPQQFQIILFNSLPFSGS